ncbi:mannitol dehydrogenase family protein [Vibrio penaeicida]|uniref:mannitol dehydrogenase family protein n=1 Tax=Vibrio penaeicida TaxID=104609 RepID=UPI00273393B9|nr:mannitol dehydrogenase family protein [Vibrio penaeicida]MDP2571560.1 mannitol dehydrogenase family protein [Vibrio penaeicida]
MNEHLDMDNLSNSTLPTNIKFPAYDRSRLKSKMVHIGLGAFHRAHQAVFLDKLLTQDDQCDWGICAVSLFSGYPTIQALRSQNHLFSVTEQSCDQSETRVVGSIIDSLHPVLDGKNTIINKLADPITEVVTLTITEKGYCIDGNTGRLNTKSDHVQHDLKYPHDPITAIGYLVRALEIRRLNKVKPFTLLSCDNFRENGEVLRAVILDFSMLSNPDLYEWIKAHGAFPSSMVDCIAPSMSEELHSDIETVLDVPDPCAVICEPFRQWVIEDKFSGSRPELESVGVNFVEDVRPYEELKLRMLNGTHSLLAYIGYLAGFELISDAMSHEVLNQVAKEMMISQAQTISPPEGVCVNQYADELLARFQNPNLRHSTWQVAMDGSIKIPQRILPSLEILVERNLDFTWQAFCIAAWIRYVSGIDLLGNDIEVKDPMAEVLKMYHDGSANENTVEGILSLTAIFPPALNSNNNEVSQTISDIYHQINREGMLETVASYLKISRL